MKLKLAKTELTRALRVLGKVVCQTSPVAIYHAVRSVGNADGVRAMATDGSETVSLQVDALADGAVDFCLQFRDLKELLRVTRTETLELSGEHRDYPELEALPSDAVVAELPANFTELLALAAPIVDLKSCRSVLQGINLSADGITVTDGKQLLHLPLPLKLEQDATIPFPSALLAAKLAAPGRLLFSDNIFQLEIGDFLWRGRMPGRQYPNWRAVIPAPEKYDYSITLENPDEVLAWVKSMPCLKRPNGVVFHAEQEGLTLVSFLHPDYRICTAAAFTGHSLPHVSLVLDREILLRMLLQGYTTFKARSDGSVPALAVGGAGQFIAMPIRSTEITTPV